MFYRGSTCCLKRKMHARRSSLIVGISTLAKTSTPHRIHIISTLFLSDMYTTSEKLSFFLFTYDTNLPYADKTLRSLEATINEELRNLSNWVMVYKFSINVKKSYFVIFRPYQKRVDSEVNINIFDYSASSLLSLDRKEYIKYLGVLIDSKFSWTYLI